MADRKVAAKGIANQSSSPVSGGKVEVQRAFPPLSRQDVLKWNAWGYKDSGFKLNEKGQGAFTGNRYALSGKTLPGLIPFMTDRGYDKDRQSFSQPPPTDDEVPKPTINMAFEAAISSYCVKMSHSGMDRIVHSHGHTCHELFSLRTHKWGRIPDVVVWPGSHKHVEEIVAAATLYNVCVIPFGGGTNVSGALLCPAHERRSIVSLDTTAMDRILWVDENNLTVRVEAGIIGQDMERQLREKRFTCGHEPDSIEFSSVGGWVATRSSGMKKNVYGNIEDLVVNVTMVTPQGVIERSFNGPRNALGPDVQQVIIGSEGILGVITEVTLKIRPLPPIQRYGSILFKEFESGILFMREVAKQRCAPASIRLMDSEQFLMGQAVKEAPQGMFGSTLLSLKRAYLTKFKGFDLTKCSACTLLFEGTDAEVTTQEKRIYSIASEFGGIQGGSENGHYGYMMTYCIAYMRDMGFDYCFVAESFETSVPWDRISSMIRNVKDRVKREGERLGVKAPVLISSRVTQTYDAGACIYFYLIFNYNGITDPVGTFDAVELAAREEVLSSGGSLSHHHGVGKIRKKFVESSISAPGVAILRSIKDTIDPKNIFGSDNLIPNPRPKL